MKEAFIPKWKVQALWALLGAVVLFLILSAGFAQNWLLIPALLCLAGALVVEIVWIRCPVCGSCLPLWLVTDGMLQEEESRYCPRCGERIEVR